MNFSGVLAQVSDERVVVGSDTGHILLFENGEMKADFFVSAASGVSADDRLLQTYVFFSLLLIKLMIFLGKALA